MTTKNINQQDLLNYYSGLLIVQYRMKPKAIATVQLLCNQSVCDNLLSEMLTCFDLDVAVGKQIDILGKIVGVPRSVYGLDLTHTYFNFTDYASETSDGFGKYADNPYSTDLFLRYNNSAIYVLSDFEMQNLIRIKIIQNNTDATLEDITDAFFAVFGSQVSITDNQNMFITYNVSSIYATVILAAQFLDVLPRPMGCGVHVNLV